MLILDIHNLDIYIKECFDCAQTCRICAEAHTDKASKFAEYINACLECAKICEATAKTLLLYKSGAKNIRLVQIQACIVACSMCAQKCRKLEEKNECFAACVESALRCEEIMRALMRSGSPPKNTKVAAFLRSFSLRKTAL